METEVDKLRRDMQRYRYLLAHNSDPRTTKVLGEMLSEAEARLRAIAPQTIG